jgi:hypothetical protein
LAEIMNLHPDFKDLLAECVRASLEFAVLGGYAVGFHARPRATKDIDLLVLRTPENLARLAQALEAFGAPANVVAAAPAAKEDEVLYFGVKPLRVDIMTRADGIDTATALRRVVFAEIADLRIPILSREDLLANKRAAGRPQDLADVHALERARDAELGEK